MAHRLCGEGEKSIDALQTAISILDEEGGGGGGGGGGDSPPRSPSRKDREPGVLNLVTAQKQLAITYNSEGTERFSKKNYNAARRWFSKAIEQDPDTRAYYVNRGDCCREVPPPPPTHTTWTIVRYDSPNHLGL